MQRDLLDRICRRAHYLAVQMIHLANNRSDKEKGDPKIGGHPAASASSLHILGALHLVVRTGFDHIANKPHASPADHSYNYLLDLFLKPDLSKLSLAEANEAMHGLRKFSQNDEYVFQSYHSAYDCDHHNYLPSGTVGIPPVNLGYLAHAYRFAAEHGYRVPKNAHFWGIVGDSEFREGSLYEAMPDFAEREIGNLTWIVDYNRQSLDGHRITNKEIMNGTDDMRIERTAIANGWEVFQVRHGRLRQELFKRPNGKDYQKFLEQELQDYELQALLLVQDPKFLKDAILKTHPHMKKFLGDISTQELFDSLRDLGGHDLEALVEAMEASKKSTRKPTLIVAHTVKGWGLGVAAAPGNHSALIDQEEMDRLREAQGIKADELFAGFTEKTAEGKFLKKRGDELYNQIVEQHKIKAENEALFAKRATEFGEVPSAIDINYKMANYPHTQWMLGQLTAKLTRIANTPTEGDLKGNKALTDEEKRWKLPAEMMVSMAPDVGTSTNLNPAMDGKIYGAPVVEDVETTLGVKDRKTPDLVPGEEKSDRFLRFEISEGNVMSCMGSYGRLRDVLGIPLMPLMTVYDFFVKRALDQFFYNLYWKSSFVLVGTPAGVTLSPEGAQHGWKSDIQIPNQITWEPFYIQELDWILSDSLKRHVMNDNEGRTGVFIRGVTRGVDQKGLMKYLTRQRRYKRAAPEAPLFLNSYPVAGGVDESTLEAFSEAEILTSLRDDVLAGAYYLIDYRGYANYEPGDNVVNIFSLGSPTTEAIKASEALLAKGIYANVIVVTCTDLVVGNLAHENGYSVLRDRLQINNALYLQPQLNGNPTTAEVITMAGRRVPVVSVHDGEPGLLDNIGSVIGVRQEALAVRKHSKCGRPSEVYAYHHIDADSVAQACEHALAAAAEETVVVTQATAQELRERTGANYSSTPQYSSH
jgi:pyruvate dehydrogenase E1 component